MYHCPTETTPDCCRRDTCCLIKVAAVLGAIFLFALGILIGAFIWPLVFLALPAVIVFVVILLIMTLVTIGYLRCRRNS